MLITETKNIFCGLITPPEFTAEQVINCQRCRHISGKKIWCCHFGVSVVVGGKIIQPNKKIIMPKRPCNDEDFKADYETAMSSHQGGNGELIKLEEYVQRRTTCKECPERLTCPVKGCSRWRVLIEKKRNCPKGRF